ncbi:hypothetical protein NJI34_07540 [Pseudomonas sp. S 311-6]|nr:hypothetical protein [Pseudomonas sp. S 311-6]
MPSIDTLRGLVMALMWSIMCVNFSICMNEVWQIWAMAGVWLMLLYWP